MDPTPTLGGMYKFMEIRKNNYEQEKEDKMLMATRKSKKFIRMTGQKDSANIDQSARKLDFFEIKNNPIIPYAKDENINSINCSGINFTNENSYKDKCFRVF